MTRRLAVSFSGGETSAFMTIKILKHMKEKYDEIIVVFCNSSQEDDRCLDFVHWCDAWYGFNTIWLEPVVHFEKNTGTSFKIVNYKTADRKGFAFEQMIKKYGIPNRSYPHCTRELKLQPFTSFLRSIGWSAGSYDTAIGIRADEIDRIAKDATKKRIIYPLIKTFPTRKADVNRFFASEPWRLQGPSWGGNCRWCWKKTKRKHFTLIKHTPDVFDFPKRMEQLYGYVGSEFKRPDAIQRMRDGYKRVFFRSNSSTTMLFDEYEKIKDTFLEYHDENQVYDSEMDQPGGCGNESCEFMTQENEDDV